MHRRKDSAVGEGDIHTFSSSAILVDGDDYVATSPLQPTPTPASTPAPAPAPASAAKEDRMKNFSETKDLSQVISAELENHISSDKTLQLESLLPANADQILPQSPRQRLECPFCPANSTPSHDCTSQKPYECMVCEAHFWTLHNLKRHTKWHAGARANTCLNWNRKLAGEAALPLDNRGGCASARRSRVGFEDALAQQGTDSSTSQSHSLNVKDETSLVFETRGIGIKKGWIPNGGGSTASRSYGTNISNNELLRLGSPGFETTMCATFFPSQELRRSDPNSVYLHSLSADTIASGAFSSPENIRSEPRPAYIAPPLRCPGMCQGCIFYLGDIPPEIDAENTSCVRCGRLVVRYLCTARRAYYCTEECWDRYHLLNSQSQVELDAQSYGQAPRPQNPTGDIGRTSSFQQPKRRESHWRPSSLSLLPPPIPTTVVPSRLTYQ